jgi:hypothetical protein
VFANLLQRSRRQLFPLQSHVLFGLAVSGLLSGCATNPLEDRVWGPSYQPQNIYTEGSTLPAKLRRLASLEPLLLAELGRVNQFELVPVTPEQLHRWTGRSSWTGEEKLPQDFFEKLRAAVGVDGVLLSRLTQYRAFEPLAIGWRIKLLDAQNPSVVWAIDEVFDARQSDVANAARRFAQAHPTAGDSRATLMSPRRFAQYTASAVFQTLPAR